LWAIYKQAAPALLLLGGLAGAVQLLDAGIGLFEHDPGKCAGPLFIAVLHCCPAIRRGVSAAQSCTDHAARSAPKITDAKSPLHGKSKGSSF
jgi:hypothetical protein